MVKRTVLEELDCRPLLCDGAMGTQLMDAGLPAGGCGEQWNLDEPDKIELIHRRYLDAGCDLITTCTFGGTEAALGMHSLSGQAAEINTAAAGIAKRAAGEHAFVLADIGPFGGFLEPLGETTADELLDMFQRQAQALHGGGADAAIVETMTDLAELTLAVKAAKSVAPWPVIATAAFDRAAVGSYRTMMGATVIDAVEAASEAGADVVGANCGASMELDDYVRLAEQIVAAARDTPVIIQPNAGKPRLESGELIYPASPENMGDLVPRLLDIGVRIIGGCCGTTPEHLRSMARAIKSAGRTQ